MEYRLAKTEDVERTQSKKWSHAESFSGMRFIRPEKILSESRDGQKDTNPYRRAGSQYGI